MLLATVCLLSIVNSAKADNIFIDPDIDTYVDNRRVIQRKTVVKKYYIEKQVPVPVPVEPAPVPVAPPPMEPPPVRAIPLDAPVPYGAYGCRLQKAQAIVDMYGRVIDYTYIKVCL